MTYHVKDLEAGPLLDQAVLRALGAVHVLDFPDGVPESVRDNWPEAGAMVLTDEAGNQMFYAMTKIPQFSTQWGVGGPLLFEREGVAIQPWWGPAVGARPPGPPLDWLAFTDRPRQNAMAYKPLVAACRALVLAKLGPTVDLFDPFAKFGTASAVQGPPR